jgi:exocyst complex component 2
VYEEAQRVFSAMLDRQQKAERIKSVVAMLKRYETVFRLPTRIRQATERGEFEQVIAEHRKAKALMETLASSSSEVWRNLFSEVEKVRPLNERHLHKDAGI